MFACKWLNVINFFGVTLYVIWFHIYFFFWSSVKYVGFKLTFQSSNAQIEKNQTQIWKKLKYKSTLEKCLQRYSYSLSKDVTQEYLTLVHIYISVRIPWELLPSISKVSKSNSQQCHCSKGQDETFLLAEKQHFCLLSSIS